MASVAPSALFPTASLSPKFNPQPSDAGTSIPRRDFAALTLLAVAPVAVAVAVAVPPQSLALGISGPKEWLKEQKRKSSKFLLAPIYASREILQSAYAILVKDSDYTNEDIEQVQRLLRSAARDCVPQDRNSFVNFQANTGVEVCTFKLIVKNAASLLADKDPVKLEAEAILDNLIGSFSSLNGLANEMDVQLSSNSRQRVVAALKDTVSSLDKLEQGVKDCLEV